METPVTRDICNNIAHDAVQALDISDIRELQETAEEWHDGKNSAMLAFSRFLMHGEKQDTKVFKKLPVEARDAIETGVSHDEQTKLMALRDFAQEIADAIELAEKLEKAVRAAWLKCGNPVVISEVVSRTLVDCQNRKADIEGR